MTAQVAIVVPVLGRPHHAQPFMESLRSSTVVTSFVAVYAVCDWGDDAAHAWRAAGARVFYDHDRDGRPGTFAEKVNRGYAETREPWLFLVGSDVRFHPGWLGAALRAAARTGAQVVGTNDLGNVRVMAGEHATHMLISRRYVDDLGASWDGPGVVCHEGYRHWYVDDELVTVAKHRGTFTVALDSLVEHLHPLFGKGDDDEVYQLGRSFTDQDAATFARRSMEHADA